MTNEVLQSLLTRRSCKKYRSDPVDRTLVEAVVEAGLYAASGSNLQGTIILAVTDKATRDRLSRLNAKYDPMGRTDPFYNAPVVLAVLGDKTTGTAVEDGSLVLGNMMLAAHALGLGSCWIHRAQEAFDDPDGLALLQELGVQGDYVGVGHLVLGYPEVLRTNLPPRKEGRVFRV